MCDCDCVAPIGVQKFVKGVSHRTGDWYSFQIAIVVPRFYLISYDIAPSAKMPTPLDLADMDTSGHLNQAATVWDGANIIGPT